MQADTHLATCMHTMKQTCTCTCRHITGMEEHICTDIHIHQHAETNIHTDACTGKNTKHTLTHIYRHTGTDMHEYKHAHICTHRQRHAHTYIQAPTCTLMHAPTATVLLCWAWHGSWFFFPASPCRAEEGNVCVCLYGPQLLLLQLLCCCCYPKAIEAFSTTPRSWLHPSPPPSTPQGTVVPLPRQREGTWWLRARWSGLAPA